MSNNQSDKSPVAKRDESLFFVRLFILMSLITLCINLFVDKKFQAAGVNGTDANGYQTQMMRLSIAMTVMTSFTGIVALVLSKGGRRWMCGGLILLIIFAAIKCNYFAGMIWHGITTHFR